MNLPVRSRVRHLGIGLLVGIFSALFGLRGGVILVPIFLRFAVEQRRDQATSLGVVAIAAVSGGISYTLGVSMVCQAGPSSWPEVLLEYGSGLCWFSK